MSEQFSRTELILGKEALQQLKKAHIAIFGIGGVGGYVAEALARAGIGALDLIDNDVVTLSNLNRQIIALHSTIGQAKVDVMAKRIKDINPDCKVKTYQTFFLPEKSNEFNFTQYNYVVDAIDTVSGKIGLIVASKNACTPIISAMGAGNKTDPTSFEVADIYKTSVCPLAHVMRKELKKRNIKSLKVVYSKETPFKINQTTPGSTPFVPPVVGMIIASEVIKDLINTHE